MIKRILSIAIMLLFLCFMDGHVFAQQGGQVLGGGGGAAPSSSSRDARDKVKSRQARQSKGRIKELKESLLEKTAEDEETETAESEDQETEDVKKYTTDVKDDKGSKGKKDASGGDGMVLLEPIPEPKGKSASGTGMFELEPIPPEPKGKSASGSTPLKPMVFPPGAGPKLIPTDDPDRDYPPWDYPQDQPGEHRSIQETREHERWKKIERKLSGHVVGIGASAGSLEVIREIVDQLPKDISTAFIIVQHPEPKHKVIYAKELLGLTEMSVADAEDGMIVENNRIYVVPPGVYMAIVDNVLEIIPQQEVKDPNMPIDQFLTSLAKDQGTRAVGIILSGDTTDGADGLRNISKAGGMTIVQDGDTAEYAKMPKSAISTGEVTMVLSPKGIVRELKKLRKPLVKTKMRIDDQGAH